MAVLHTVAVAADTVVVAELELHTVAVVHESVVDFGLIGPMRSRDFGLIGPMGSRDFGLIGPMGLRNSLGLRVEFPVVSDRNRHT